MACRASLPYVLLLVGCTPVDHPPEVSFLVVAGDSTYWVERSDDRLRVRASPLFLARLGREFSELYVADEAFLCGTGAQVAVVGSIDGRSVGSGERGPVTEKIQDVLFSIVRGENKK